MGQRRPLFHQVSRPKHPKPPQKDVINMSLEKKFIKSLNSEKEAKKRREECKKIGFHEFVRDTRPAEEIEMMTEQERANRPVQCVNCYVYMPFDKNLYKEMQTRVIYPYTDANGQRHFIEDVKLYKRFYI